MKIKSIWLRTIHKWVGLVIGLQFLMWAISGAGMAILDMKEVAGGPASTTAPLPMEAPSAAWSRVQASLGGEPVTGLKLRSLPQGRAYEIATPRGTRLFSAGDGRPIRIDEATAAAVASAAHPEGAPIRSIESLDKVGFAVRDHALPIWRVDFSDNRNSSYYVSGTTGELIERRNDSWRLWDVLWMLHIMDYSDRSNFNHPLIITVGFAMAWLAITGFWLLFRTMWKHDFRAFRQLGEARGARSIPAE